MGWVERGREGKGEGGREGGRVGGNILKGAFKLTSQNLRVPIHLVEDGFPTSLSQDGSGNGSVLLFAKMRFVASSTFCLIPSSPHRSPLQVSQAVTHLGPRAHAEGLWEPGHSTFLSW